MAGKGNWTLQDKMNRCTGERKCAACTADPERKPHGPYYSLRRRNPADGVSQQSVYLGRQGLSEDQLLAVNKQFSEQEDPPTRMEVLVAATAAILP